MLLLLRLDGRNTADGPGLAAGLALAPQHALPDASLAPACGGPLAFDQEGAALVQHAKAACAAARSPPNMALADGCGAAGLPPLACSRQMHPRP